MRHSRVPAPSVPRDRPPARHRHDPRRSTERWDAPPRHGSDEPPAPDERPVRLRYELIDALRGFAVLGIFWRNVFVFGMPFFAYAVPGLIDADTVPDKIAMVFVAAFTEGTMRALLSILFGASVLLILAAPTQDGDDPLEPVDRHFRRLLWLAAFGLAHAYLLLWPHDILFLYGVLGLALFPFRRLKTRPLMVIGLALLLGSTVIEGTGWRAVGSAVGKIEAIEEDWGPDLPMPDEGLKEILRDAAPEGSFLEGRLDGTPSDPLGWIVSTARAQDQPVEGTSTDDGGPDGASAGETDGDGEPLSLEEFEMLAEAMTAIETETEARLAGYASNFRSLASETFEQQTTELFSHHILDIGAMLFIGMALLKAGILTGAASVRLYRNLALWGLVGGAVLGVLAHDALIGIEPLMPLSIAIGDYLFDARRLALAFGVIGLFGWLAASGRAGGLLRLLAVPGRMALSLYVMQTVIGITIFYGFGAGLFGTLPHAQLLAFAFTVTAFQLWLAHVWSCRFGRGPLERLLGWLVGPSRPTPVTSAR